MCLDVVYYRFRSMYPRLFFNLSFVITEDPFLHHLLSPLLFLYSFSSSFFYVSDDYDYDDDHHLQLLSNTLCRYPSFVRGLAVLVGCTHIHIQQTYNNIIAIYVTEVLSV